MKTPKNKQIAVKRIFAVLSAVLVLSTVFCISVFADDVTSFGGYTSEAKYTILYNADVNSTSSLQSWTFTPETEFLYTDIYLCIVYTAVTPTNGSWLISQDGDSASFRLDNFSQGQGYRVATAYIDNFTLADSQNITFDYLAGFGTPDIRVEYVLIANTVDEMHLYEVAEFLAYNENDVSQFNQLFIRTISENAEGYYSSGSFSGYDRGYKVGYVKGKGDGYDEGYALGETNGHTIGYNSGYQQGYSVGKDIGYGEGYQDGSDGIGIEKLPFAVTDSIANMFVKITNFDILGINVLALLGSIISICVVAFVIKKVF